MKKDEIYRHFKGAYYRIIGVAKHSESLEDMVVYQGLYENHPLFVRPISMFEETLDVKKYPNATQKKRFMRVMDIKEPMMENLGYYNGNVGPIEEMTISMNDRSTYFGDGVYESCLVHNQKIFSLNEHIDRFYTSLAKIKIPFTMEKEELKALLLELVKKVKGEYTTLYWQTTRGTATRSHEFPDAKISANLLITIQPRKMEDIHRQLALCTVEDTRFKHCDVKTLNLLPNVLASEYAKEHGCDEAVFYREGFVSECAHSNIFILKNKTLYTAPLNHMILPGISRKHMIEIANKLHIPVVEEAFTLEDLKNADEIIISSTGKFCMCANRLNGERVGNHDCETFKSIQNAYLEKFEMETKSN